MIGPPLRVLNAEERGELISNRSLRTLSRKVWDEGDWEYDPPLRVLTAEERGELISNRSLRTLSRKVWDLSLIHI